MTTPLLSVRRAPGVLSRQVNLTALQAALQPLLASVDDNRCFALAIDGQQVAAKNDTLPLSPASNLKILTAAVALDVLGPGFTYSTKVVGALGADGVVQGDMYLVGGGDPVLASEWWNGNNPKWPPFNETSFESLADAIQQHGVTKITGSLIGDGSRYDDEYFAPTWAAADHITQAGPIDASAGQRLVADAAGRREGSGARRGDGAARHVEGPRNRRSATRRPERPRPVARQSPRCSRSRCRPSSPRC